MRKFMLSFLMLGGMLNAEPIDNYLIKQQNIEAGLMSTLIGSTPTFALNMVTPTVRSTAIDLSATGALMVCITGTSGTSPQVMMFWSNTNTTGTFMPGTYRLGAGCWPVKAQGRWLQFVSYNTVSLTAKTSVNYYVAANGIQIAGSALPSGAATESTLFAELTTTAALLDAVNVKPLPRWTLKYDANLTVNSTTPQLLNLTNLAGVNATVKYRFASVGAAPSIYWRELKDSTWVAPQALYSVSTTPIQDDFAAPGTHLALSHVAGVTAVTSTVEVKVWTLQSVSTTSAP